MKEEHGQFTEGEIWLIFKHAVSWREKSMKSTAWYYSFSSIQLDKDLIRTPRCRGSRVWENRHLQKSGDGVWMGKTVVGSKFYQDLSALSLTVSLVGICPMKSITQENTHTRGYSLKHCVHSRDWKQAKHSPNWINGGTVPTFTFYPLRMIFGGV